MKWMSFVTEMVMAGTLFPFIAIPDLKTDARMHMNLSIVMCCYIVVGTLVLEWFDP
jgi:hypothetical protein